ncbi:hypothetical protein AAS21_gp048 [Pantoea phage vB_PagS_AAS21]|uniref:Uncharacterized protein n=1 Tax=Pantoea phage vB_PagS_AAS21 TaxID=2575261 RepID=A0A4Y5P1F5_9CAUD|nr:hypothetical protein AAS21_gp048 [Pantoea phage vB_PagS_AAS21]
MVFLAPRPCRGRKHREVQNGSAAPRYLCNLATTCYLVKK